MHVTRVVSGESYRDLHRKSIKEIDLKIRSLHQEKSVFMNSDKKMFYLDFLSESLQCVDFKDDVTRILSQCLVSNAIRSASITPFFGDFSLLYSINLLKSASKKSISKSQYDKVSKNIINIIENNTFLPTRKDVLRFIKEATFDPLTFALIHHAFENSGMTGKIFFEDRKVKKSTIEIKNAYSFDVETFNEFFFEENTWTHEMVNVIVIDGIIENVSEINNLLEMSSKNVDPTVIVARGFGDDVLQTLYVNMQRKTLNVLPVKLTSDERGINDYVDISVVSKTDPVSYLKGDLISKIDYSEVSSVEKLEVRPGKLTIVNNIAKRSVWFHLENIKRNVREKREHLDPAGAEILDRSTSRRVQALGGQSIHVSPSASYNHRDLRLLKIEIDSSFKTIPIIRDFGMVDVQGFLKDLEKQKDMDLIYSSVKKSFSKFKKIPAGSLINCLKSCHSNAMLLNETSGALLDERS